MEKEFVTYKLAVKLKALGFDEPCWCYFMEDVFNASMFLKDYEYLNTMPQKYITYTLAPLRQQAFRWLMQFPQIKKYRYNIALYPDGTYSLKDGKDSIYEYLSGDDCIDKLIEIVENK